MLISTTTLFKDKVVFEKFTSTYLHQSAREIMLSLVNNSHEERVTKRSPIRSVIMLMTNQNRTTAKRESDLSITSMITDRIGRLEVLLPNNHNCHNFRKKNQKHLGQTSPVETMSKIKKNPSFWKFPSFSFSG